MREKYESLSAAALKELAKARGLRHISGLRKSEVIERMLEADTKENGSDGSVSQPEEKKENREVRANKGNSGNNSNNSSNNGGSNNTSNNSGNSGGSNNYTSNNSGNSGGSNNYTSNNSSNSGGNNNYTSNNSGSNNNSNTNSSYNNNNGSSSNNNSSNNSSSNSYSNNNNNNNSSAAPSSELSQLDSGQQASGILEVLPDGYGFIRCENYLPGENDVYVSPSQIRRFNLKTGDIIAGNTRVKTQQEKFSALLYLKTINGLHPAEAAKRLNFEDMTPIFPNERLRMERGPKEVSMRIMDMISPIGKGQRGMIVSPPKAGKTTLLKDVAKSILRNSPQMHLIILLIDERPEEVTDIREAICGPNVEVIYSTFDELPEHHKRVSEMVIERAKRLVEHRKDVTILLDSITRLARAYNLTVPPSGRTLSGGLDPAALHMPKRFFGAARNMREGGSLTILATALVDTGSKMDDVVYEEFKGTGNMELVLDRKLSEKRVFPAIDIPKSGTRRDDLLLDADEQEAAYIMRKALNGMKSDEAVENILNLFVRTRNNKEFTSTVRRQKYV
ncbi:transcription termination factor Rho [Murimonas intestini]|nr:transcription termination factor Rho [Murimonas intestini]MCR1843204.1 transcription termination factor Rho [Murimonas intestini]MCR1868567.1 transcription termination factor Rho [Murimonas intestini]MCR1885136.1 transcription termination factor Rho [Murimonas intestini]